MCCWTTARASDPQSAMRRAMGVSDVVVTPQLKRWHAVHTLEVFYRDAFNNQLNDRYKAKCAEYQRAFRKRAGQDVSLRDRAGADSDSAGADADVQLRRGNLPERSYYVQVSWVSASGTGRATQLLDHVRVPGRRPAGGNGGKSTGRSATGFNVYMGLTPKTVTLQNSAAVAVGAQLHASERRAGDRRGVRAAGRRRMFTWPAEPY